MIFHKKTMSHTNKYAHQSWKSNNRLAYVLPLATIFTYWCNNECWVSDQKLSYRLVINLNTLWYMIYGFYSLFICVTLNILKFFILNLPWKVISYILIDNSHWSFLHNLTNGNWFFKRFSEISILIFLNVFFI